MDEAVHDTNLSKAPRPHSPLGHDDVGKFYEVSLQPQIAVSWFHDG